MRLLIIKKALIGLLMLGIGFNLISCTGLPNRMGQKDNAPLIPRPLVFVRNATPKVEMRSRSGNPTSYVIKGKRYYVKKSSKGYVEKGIASWYGTKFHGRKTSSGEPYNMYGMTAAHKNLPLPTYLKVKNLQNGKEVIVKVNDRGPFVSGRIIDLSYAAAKKLGVFDNGTAPVKITAIDPKKWNKRKWLKLWPI